MKDIFKYILFALFIFSNVATLASPFQRFPKRDTISILDAKLNKKLAVSIRGAYDPNRLQPDLVSAHFGECIDIRLRNMSDSVLNVVLKCGTMLLSRDSSFQNMVVTKTLFYTLKPREEHYDRVYAMCGQLHKNSPDISIRYDVGDQAEEPLLKLAKLIEKTNHQNKAGQYAVWAVTDGATKDDLGEDFDALQQSQALLNKANIQLNILGKHTNNHAAIPIQNKQNKSDIKKSLATTQLSKTANKTTSANKIEALKVEEKITELAPIVVTFDKNESEFEKEDEFPSNVQLSDNEVVETKNENYWLLVASFCVILFGMYYFWKKKPNLPPKNNSGLA